jgi:hypothetical protein
MVSCATFNLHDAERNFTLGIRPNLFARDSIVHPLGYNDQLFANHKHFLRLFNFIRYTC